VTTGHRCDRAKRPIQAVDPPPIAGSNRARARRSCRSAVPRWRPATGRQGTAIRGRQRRARRTGSGLPKYSSHGERSDIGCLIERPIGIHASRPLDGLLARPPSFPFSETIVRIARLRSPPAAKLSRGRDCAAPP
jgi:hypothetical protein